MLIFEKPKGQRIHKRFIGVTNFSGLWWCHKSRVWVEDIPDPSRETVGIEAPCHSIRAFRRHLRKNPNIRGKAILVSRFIGYNVKA